MAYFFRVNTPSLLKKLAEFLISRVGVVDNSEHTLSSSAGYSLNSSRVHPGIHGLKQPLIAPYSSLYTTEVATEVKKITTAEEETPEKEKSCCNIFRVWGRLKERYYGTSLHEQKYEQKYSGVNFVQTTV